MASLDSFKCRKSLTVGAKAYDYFSLKAAERSGLAGVSTLPFSLKIVLENLLRNEDGRTVTKADIEAVSAWVHNKGKTEHEIAFRPARVLMQDFTGVPAVVDLAAMRDAMTALGGDPDKINPLVPVDLVIDHSVVVDHFGTSKSLGQNVAREYEQNQERYRFLKWGQQAFSNFSVVPPGTGICHQVNLEYLAQTVWTAQGEEGRQDGRGRLSRYAGRHRQPHHHGQRPRRARLGRRRHRGRGGHARPASVDAAAGSDRLQARRGTARGRHGDRSRADRHPDAAQEGRRRQIRRVLRRRPQRHVGRGPGDARQHGAGIRRDLRPLPDRRADHRLSQVLRPQAVAHRARRGLRKGARDLPHPRDAGAGVHRYARTQPRRGRSLARRPEAPAGPRGAERGQVRVRAGHDDRVQARRRACRAPQGRGDELRPRRRRRRDRRDHLLHQHLEPERDAGCWPGRPQRRRQGPDGEAVGQDFARAGQSGRA